MSALYLCQLILFWIQMPLQSYQLPQRIPTNAGQTNENLYTTIKKKKKRARQCLKALIKEYKNKEALNGKKNQSAMEE